MSNDAHYTPIITVELHLLFIESDVFFIHERRTKKEIVFYNIHGIITRDFASNDRVNMGKGFVRNATCKCSS